MSRNAWLGLCAAILSGCTNLSVWLDGPEPREGSATLPQVLDSGGRVLSAPRVVPIFFAGDSAQSEIEQFLAALPGSSYWSATTGEYGVGDVSIAPSVVVPDLPSTAIDDSEIEQWLAAHIDGANPAWPRRQADDIYLVIYPQTTTVTADDEAGCVDFGGYHYEGHLDSSSNNLPPSFAYVVIPACPDIGLSPTSTISHELIEASTDPFPVSAPAFFNVDQDHLAWAFYVAPSGPIAAGEVADLCNTELYGAALELLLGGFPVQRSWSNAAASARRDPCVPSPSDPYFNAAPELRDRAILAPYPGQLGYLTDGIEVPLGVSRTIEVHAFSTAPRASWFVGAYEPRASSDLPATLAFTWDRQTANDGDVLHVTITRLAEGPAGGSQMAVYSTEDEPGSASGTMWPGFVAN
ncbi:MAG TPA: hypothetical protein VGI10_31460 [Polyangiaceae bacterium]